jgi:hypothetical protein
MVDGWVCRGHAAAVECEMTPASFIRFAVLLWLVLAVLAMLELG